MIVISGLAAKAYRMTADGMHELRRQLEGLKKKRMEVAHELRDITSQSTDMGAREDSTFALSQNQAQEIDSQIVLLERIVGLANVVEKPKSNRRVQFGSRVAVKLDSDERVYTVVGPVEADPAEAKISEESPFGRSLLGRKVHDQVEVVSPNGRRLNATILGIF